MLTSQSTYAAGPADRSPRHACRTASTNSPPHRRASSACPRWLQAAACHASSRVLFFARRHAEAAGLLGRLTAGSPLEHPRELAWQAAACSHLGHAEEARRCGGLFVEAVRRAWRGDRSAGPAAYVDWLVNTSYLRRREDEAHLREGLRLADLPA